MFYFFKKVKVNQTFQSSEGPSSDEFSSDGGPICISAFPNRGDPLLLFLYKISATLYDVTRFNVEMERNIIIRICSIFVYSFSSKDAPGYPSIPKR